MTEVEFENAARRILVAFELPADYPKEVELNLPCEISSETYYTLSIDLEGFRMRLDFWETSQDWTISLMNEQKDRLSYFWPYSSSKSVDVDGDYMRYATALTRAMYRLDFDISLIETELGLTITAHEKQEWQLEFQRRLREGTLQVE